RAVVSSAVLRSSVVPSCATQLVVLRLVSFLTTRLPPTSTLFPYTTLFRSGCRSSCPRRRSRAATARTSARSASCAISRWCASSRDRKSTRLNSSHQIISYAVFCLKKKKQSEAETQHKPNRHVSHETDFASN